MGELDVGGIERSCRRSPAPQTHHAERAAVHHLGGDHGGPHVLMPEQRLEGADVRACLEKVGGEAVPQGVASHALVELRRPRRFVYGLLYRGLVQGVQDGPPRCRVGAGPGDREEGLPEKRRPSVGHLDAQRLRQIDLTTAGFELGSMAGFHLLELSAQAIAGTRSQKRCASVASLAAADHDRVARKVHVLDPYREAVEQAEAAAVEDFADEPERGFELVEKDEHVAAREHGREGVGAKEALHAFQGAHFQVEDTPVQEDEGTEGLVLGGGRDPALQGEGGQEAALLGRAFFPGVAASVEKDERGEPVEVGFFGARAGVQAAEGGPHGIHEDHGDALGPGRPNTGRGEYGRGLMLGIGEYGRGLMPGIMEYGRGGRMRCSAGEERRFSLALRQSACTRLRT
jgi:hypothetical protein